MSYLLDADWIISFLNGQRPAVELVTQLANAGLFVSAIAYGEVYEGLLGRQEVAFNIFAQFMTMVDLLPVDERVAKTY